MYDMYSNLSAIAMDYGAGKDRNAVHPKAPAWTKGTDIPKPIGAIPNNSMGRSGVKAA
jgi:hypothetical protein